jgi:uncharacterized protein YceK
MNRLIPIAALTVTAILMAGCATVTRETAQRQSADTLATTNSQPHRAASTELKGQTAAAWGDNFTATNLFEQAEAKHDSPLNRFNLATSYQQTGRVAEAVKLYRTVVIDGGHTWAYSVPDNADRSARGRHYNLATESLARLEIIDQGVVAKQDTDAKRALATTGVRGPGPNTGKISDARAEKLDQTVEAAPKP